MTRETERKNVSQILCELYSKHCILIINVCVITLSCGAYIVFHQNVGASISPILLIIRTLYSVCNNILAIWSLFQAGVAASLTHYNGEPGEDIQYGTNDMKKRVMCLGIPPIIIMHCMSPFCINFILRQQLPTTIEDIAVENRFWSMSIWSWMFRFYTLVICLILFKEAVLNGINQLKLAEALSIGLFLFYVQQIGNLTASSPAARNVLMQSNIYLSSINNCGWEFPFLSSAKMLERALAMAHVNATCIT